MTETDPFRLRVLKGLTAGLEEITPGNGYRHNLAGKVFRGRDMFGDDDPEEFVSILEKPVEPEDEVDQHDDDPEGIRRFELIVQGFTKDDPINPTDPGHYLMADVKKRLAAENAKGDDHDKFGIKRIWQMRWTGGVVRPPDGVVSDKAFFWLSLTLKLLEDDEDPFS